MRYNPPPNWPAPPEGWTPQPGWQPDPSWGPPPEGWQVWVDDAPGAAAAKGKSGNWFGRHKILTGLGALLAIIIVGTAAGGDGDQAALTTAGATPADTTTATGSSPAPSPAASSSTTTEAPETTTTSSVPPPAPKLAKDIAYAGRGDKVLRITKPEEGAVLATITHKGSSNFSIFQLDADNQEGDLLVNEIGNFSGTTIVDNDENTETAKLKISADGRWTVVLKALLKAKPITSAAAGTGPEVLLYKGDDAVDMTLTHRGEGNFAVYWITGDGEELLVNEIGRYDGDVPLSAGPGILKIEADGKWTATVIE